MNRNIIISLLATLLLASCGYQKKPEAASPSCQGAGKDNLPLNAQLSRHHPCQEPRQERTLLGIRHARYHRERAYHEG